MSIPPIPPQPPVPVVAFRPPGPPPRKGMSTGAKWGIGCGAGCLTMILVVAIAGFVGYRALRHWVDGRTEDLKIHGFEKVRTGQAIDVKDLPAEPVLYRGQIVRILGDCPTNLAIIAQMAEIHGVVKGKTYFRGQILVVQPRAELQGGLDIQAQVLQQLGRITGPIEGQCTTTGPAAPASAPLTTDP